MADCNDLFEKFLGTITLDDSKRDNLMTARNALRERIRKHFAEKLKASQPKFHGQGSYMMGTVVNPLSGEYDIDDGVYLQNLDKEKSNWPSPSEAHRWIYEAVDGHTDQKPVDKPTCVRVIYAGSYHVDLPIYGTYKEEYYLADTGSGWHVSDPKRITDWFLKEVAEKGDQLRSVVKYLKAWADQQSQSNGKMPSSIILTKLAADNFVARVRDDASFAKTVTLINESVSRDFTVINPVDNNEVMSDRMSATQKETFKRLIKRLSENGDKAIKDENKKNACLIWRSEFGERFSDCSQIRDDKGALYSSSPALLRNDARSA